MTAAPAEAFPRLVVLQSVPAPRPSTNPYVVTLFDSLRAAGAQVRPFSWRTALLGRYDIFHVHWPENLLRGSSRVKTALRQVLVLVLLVKLRLKHVAVVRTLHNVERHEGGSRVEGWLLDLIDRRTTLGIALNDLTEPRRPLPVVVIRHGSYRDWFARFPRSAPVPGRLAYFGLIRPYKGVEDLITAFRSLTGEFSLAVAGQPRTPELGHTIEALAADDPRIDLELAYVTDERLVELTSQAELVVLPYRQMHNSGGALAALSLDRPVLVPATPVNQALSEEAGPGWVHQFAGDLDAATITDVLTTLRTADRTAGPDLSAREWPAAAEAHLTAYRRALHLLHAR